MGVAEYRGWIFREVSLYNQSRHRLSDELTGVLGSESVSLNLLVLMT